MRKILFTVLAVFLILAVVGCGSSSSPPPVFTTQIVSTTGNDGDIELDAGGTFHVTQGNPDTVFAGVDPSTLSEFRAFLDFPLTGAGGVPGTARINAATLVLFIRGITIQSAATSIPLRIDLVSFPPDTLFASDYDRALQPALASVTASIFRGDVGNDVLIDVTPLMDQAQFSGLTNFQVRILEDFGPGILSGRVEIDDSSARPAQKPLLEVVYH